LKVNDQKTILTKWNWKHDKYPSYGL
jgi:hypothetical protein